MVASLTLLLPTPETTEVWGHRLGKLLFPGAVLALIGQLGAGKTHLTRALAEGLELAPQHHVSSPTFVLIQEYAARWPIYHFDAYRLRNDREFYDLGAHEYLEGNGICIIEWADRVPECLPADRLSIQLEITGPTSRLAYLEAHGPRHEAILERLREAFIKPC